MVSTFNVNIPDSVSKLRSVIKEFKLKENIYQLLFQSRGLEFESYRNYVQEDDASFIDWKASTRAQKLLVKQYKEERDLEVVFFIDVGSNMVFGSSEKLKCEYVIELVAAFANLISLSGDKVGLILFSNEVKKFLVPASGDRQMYIMVDMLSDTKLYGGETNFDVVLKFSKSFLTNSTSSVIFISDFIHFSEENEKEFNLLSSRFETAVLIVKDLLDKSLPSVDQEIVLQDPNTKQQLIVNPSLAKGSYKKYVQEKEEKVYDFLRKKNIDYIEFTTDKEFAYPLATFLSERVKNRKFK